MATPPKRPTTRRAKPAPTPRSRSASTPKSPARSAAAKKEARDGKGRFMPGKRTRNLAIGGTLIALGAGIGAALWRGWVRMPRGPWDDGEGHEAPDLALDAPKPGTTRAPDAFRPDPTAVPTAEELDGLRPATGPGNGWS